MEPASGISLCFLTVTAAWHPGIPSRMDWALKLWDKTNKASFYFAFVGVFCHSSRNDGRGEENASTHLWVRQDSSFCLLWPVCTTWEGPPGSGMPLKVAVVVPTVNRLQGLWSIFFISPPPLGTKLANWTFLGFFFSLLPFCYLQWHPLSFLYYLSVFFFFFLKSSCHMNVYLFLIFYFLFFIKNYFIFWGNESLSFSRPPFFFYFPNLTVLSYLKNYHCMCMHGVACCVCVCVFIHTVRCICMCVYVSAFMFCRGCAFVCVCLYVHACCGARLCVCTYGVVCGMCVFVCERACIVLWCVCEYVHMCCGVHACLCVCMCICALGFMHVCVCVCAYLLWGSCMFVCVYVHMCCAVHACLCVCSHMVWCVVHVPQQVSEGQSYKTSLSQSSPSTFEWILRIELGSWGLCCKLLYLLSYLAGHRKGAAEMTQWLGALAVLAKDPSSSSSLNTETHKCLHLHRQGCL
jgi:hypothetical protein